MNIPDGSPRSSYHRFPSLDANCPRTRLIPFFSSSRCHRIGQTKEVTVYKLVSRNTVDEDIYRMQERKSQMNAAILESDPAGGPPSSLSDFDAARERENVLKDAVERYLCSPRKAPPPPPCYEEKENSSAVL